MNRIVIDRGLEEKGFFNKTIDLNEDGNYLLEDVTVNEYNFNVKNANVNIFCNLKNINDICFNFNIENSYVSFNNFSYDCSNQSINVNLNQSKSSIDINNSFICKKRQEININVTHNYSNTNSNIYNCAVTEDNGSICFNVASKVKNKKKNCKVTQDGKIISINKTNNNTINPILLIDEYEVDAKHSAFIGKLKDDELFYLKSRGLTENQAKKLLINGFLIGNLEINEEEKEKLKELI